MNRRTQIIIMIVIGLVLAAMATFSIMTSFNNQSDDDSTQVEAPTAEQTVTINLPQGVSAELFNASEDAHGNVTENETAITTIPQSQEMQLKPGAYSIVSAATGNYKGSSQLFTVSDKAITVSVEPTFTDAKLQSLLANERVAIVQAIKSAYPNIESLYTIETGWLYEKGDWYATKLTYKGGGNQSDTLRLVAQKQADGWKVITNPPDITVSSAAYPDIPQAVVTDINNFK